MAVVIMLKTCTARQPFLLHLLCCLVFYAASLRFHFMSEHIQGELNIAADAISRNNLSLFTSLPPPRYHALWFHSRCWTCWSLRDPTGAPTTGPERSHPPYSGGLSSHAGCLPIRMAAVLKGLCQFRPLSLTAHRAHPLPVRRFLSDSVG